MSAEFPSRPPDLVQLMAEVRPALVRFFYRRCKSPAKAEDLAQEVVLRVLSRHDLTNLENAKGYIFRAAANLWRDHRRRLKTRGAAEVEWADDSVLNVTEEVSLERVIYSKEALFLVQAALLELTERTRDVFVLNRYEQMTYASIAESLGISESAVEKHMSKALEHLYRSINP